MGFLVRRYGAGWLSSGPRRRRRALQWRHGRYCSALKTAILEMLPTLISALEGRKESSMEVGQIFRTSSMKSIRTKSEGSSESVTSFRQILKWLKDLRWTWLEAGCRWQNVIGRMERMAITRQRMKMGKTSSRINCFLDGEAPSSKVPAKSKANYSVLHIH